MIKNEREYRITKAQALKFEQALSQLSGPGEGAQLHPLVKKAQVDAVWSQLEELKEELAEYELLRSGGCSVLSLDSLGELPKALIRARIAAGLTQRELAGRLGLKEQQIQRYEATEYASADFARLNEVARALGVQVREDLFLNTPQPLSEELLQRLKEVVQQTVVAFSKNA